MQAAAAMSTIAAAAAMTACTDGAAVRDESAAAAHTSMSADPSEHLTFGALCDREYGFDYEEVRRRRGLAWYALLDARDKIYWESNQNYQKSELTICTPGDYKAFGIERGRPLYSQFEMSPDKFQWVSKPALVSDLWKDYSP